jgi:CTP:molybdopterin cytidylyltransferase MocA
LHPTEDPVKHAPRVAAVVLAAGGSARLGRPKQLLEHAGEPLVRRAAREALGAGAAPVVVVLGAQADAVRQALGGLPVTTVVNDAWATGLASSLAAGVREALAEPSVGGVLVTLADQPLVDAAALARLLAAFPGEHGVVASTYADALGVPAIFARAHADALTHLTGDAGAGAWLRRRGDAVTRVPMDAAALDVDTEADVARLVARPAGQGDG